MKPTTSRRGLLASLALSSLLMGCQAMAPQAEGKPPFGSMAQITSISPDATRELRVGDRVQLAVDVRHVLTADAGTLMLIVLAADNSVVLEQSRPVTRGQGTTTLRAEFSVPRTSQIRVYTPLVYQGQDSGASTDGRFFGVVAR
jgi:hypothetical protein